MWPAFRGRGVVVVGVAIDTLTGDDPVQRARAFAVKHRLTYPVLVDGDNKAIAAYGLGPAPAVPTNLVIDRQGIIRSVQVGYSEPELRRAVEAALAEPEPGRSTETDKISGQRPPGPVDENH